MIARAQRRSDFDLAEFFGRDPAKVPRRFGAVPLDKQIRQHVAIRPVEFLPHANDAFDQFAAGFRIDERRQRVADLLDDGVILGAGRDDAVFFAALHVDAHGAGVVVMRHGEKPPACEVISRDPPAHGAYERRQFPAQPARRETVIAAFRRLGRGKGSSDAEIDATHHFIERGIGADQRLHAGAAENECARIRPRGVDQAGERGVEPATGLTQGRLHPCCNVGVVAFVLRVFDRV